MTLKISTGLRDGLLVDGDLATLMAAGFIRIYAGTEPASANDAIGSATLLCTISNNSTGTGINLETAASAGVLSKETTETWSGVNAASGVATFFRHVGAADDGTSSTTQPRIQGSVGLGGADLNLSSVSLTSGATQTIDFYTVAFPAS